MKVSPSKHRTRAQADYDVGTTAAADSERDKAGVTIVRRIATVFAAVLHEARLKITTVLTLYRATTSNEML